MTPARRRAALLTPAMALLAALLLVPLLVMVVISFSARTGSGSVLWGRFSLAAYPALLFDRDFLTDALVLNTDYLAIFRRSALFAALTTGITLLIGFPAALWLAARPRFQRTLLLFLLTVPFWTNQLVRIYAWMVLLRSGGVLESALRWLGWRDAPLELLYTPLATELGLVYSNLPYMILPIYVSLEKIDRRLVEAAFDLGANPAAAVRRVLLPLALPGIIGGMVLVFIPCLGSFIAPELLGGAKTMMIANLIQEQFGELRNWPFGAALSITLLATVLLVLGLRAGATRRAQRQVAA